MQRLSGYLLLLLVSPITGLTLALKSNNNSRYIKEWIVILTITIFGSIILLSEGNDGYRHQEKVYTHYIDLEFSQFAEELTDIVFLKTNKDVNEDIYIHLLSYLTGAIFQLPGLFFVIVSFVYGFYFSKSLFKIVRFDDYRKVSNVYLFMALVFILWRGVEGINTVRTWTGMWFLFYQSLAYLQTRKVKYLILTLFTPIFHVGYFVMVIPALVILFLGVNKRIYGILYIVSFFFSNLNQSNFLNQISQFDVGKEKIKGYYIDEVSSAIEITNRYGHATWYKVYYELGIQDMVIVFLTIVLVYAGIYARKTTFLTKSIFSIGLMFKVLANLGWFLYALSNRSNVISGIFILAAAIMFFRESNFLEEVKKSKKKWSNWGFIFVIIGFVPFVILKTSDLLDFVSFFMLIAPIIPWFVEGINISIKEVVKNLIGF